MSLMYHPLTKSDPEVVEPEIVGLQPPAPLIWKRFLARFVMGLLMGAVSIALCAAGMILTITVVGAPPWHPADYSRSCNRHLHLIDTPWRWKN